jgi:hypothetical protein
VPLTLSLIDESEGNVGIIDLRPGDLNTGFGRHWVAIGDTPLARATRRQQQLMRQAPTADYIWPELWRAIERRYRGTLRLGAFWQAKLAPLARRLMPTGVFDYLRRGILGG